MKTILITGATGNVGMEVIKCLSDLNHNYKICAGVKDVSNDGNKLMAYDVNIVHFDFTNSSTYHDALTKCDILFLLRPPQISEVKKYFKPLIEIAKDVNVRHIVFLSVQGVENSKIIPHHKIEKLIVHSRIPFTFLRPAYFMQNFLGSLHNDLVNKKEIFLPAGNASFTLVDVADVGKVAAKVLINTPDHLNRAYELTSSEILTFEEMAEELTKGLGIKINYTSPNLIRFFITKKREGVPTMLILVMIMLHYFPRFQKAPGITKSIEKIAGNLPNSFSDFIKINKEGLASLIP
ncbi:MAG: NmrA family NAD(P)-binding protein [Bacteroidetes bacterium]|nr:NmrA family NAD(P)-binding protein [Bacteroidota bacterium]